MALVTCPCGSRFEAIRSNARYCSEKCRKRGSRAGLKVARPTPLPVRATAPEPEVEVGSVVAATITDLGPALGTPAGLAAVKLAQLIDASTIMQGASVAAWTREMRAAIADAKGASAPAAKSRLQVAREARDAKRLG